MNRTIRKKCLSIVLTLAMLLSLFPAMMLPAKALGPINFDFESGTVPIADNSGLTAAPTVTQVKDGETISIVSTGGKFVVGDEELIVGIYDDIFSGNVLAFDCLDAADSTRVRVSLQSGNTFNLNTFDILDYDYNTHNPHPIMLLSSSGGAYDVGAQINYVSDYGVAAINVSEESGFQNITYFEFYANGSNMQLALDNIYLTNITPPPPTVTDANISISGASGTGGTYKIGDTVTATWNNKAGGDNNATITGVTVDFTQFGGAAIAATNDSGTWTATHTITSGAIDATNRNVSVTATDNALNSTTTADTTNAAVDNIAPTVTDANISISGGTGIGGAYKIGDTVTATWNNTAGGENNSDTISGVTVDFSAFGGGAAVAATNLAGTWTATYTMVAGGITAANRNVSVSAIDNAGNSTTAADTTNATVDNTAPSTTIATCAFSADAGNSNTDFITNTAAQTISGTLSVTIVSGETVYVSINNGNTWMTATTTVGQDTWSLSGVTLTGSSTLKVKVTDLAGNDGTVYSQAYVLDTTGPGAPSTPDLAAASDSGESNTDDITNDTTPTFTGTAEGSSTVKLYDTDGTTLLGSATATGGNWSITSSVLSSGSHTITAKVTDWAGNESAASSGLAITIDTTAPSVQSVAVPANAAYKSGQNLDFTVNFSENVTVNTFGGTPRIVITIGSSTVYANYVSGSGTAALVFRYTVAPGDADTNGILVSALQSNGGTMQDAVGNDALVTLNNIGSTDSVLVDTTVPMVASVSVPANATYKSAQNLDFTVNFDENVTVTGTPRIALVIGFSTVYANYASGSGTSALVFRYTVAPGDVDTDGITVGALGLNTGSIEDAGGNDATLTLNSVGSTAAVLVDANELTVSSINRQNPLGETTNAASVIFRVTFSKSITGVDISDFTLTKTGTADGTIASVSSTSGTMIDVTVNSISGVGTLRLDLNASGTGIQDSAGNAIAGGYTSGQTYAVDKAVPAVTITSTAPSSMNTAPIPVTITFSENVTGFAVGDITVGNGTAGNFVALSGTSYTADITPSAQGVVTVDVAADAAHDAAGNNNTAATQLSRTYDMTGPAAGGTGTITAETVTSSTVVLSWSAAMDNITTAANLQYKVVYSTSNSIGNLSDAKTNGTAFGDWTANMTSTTVTGLTARTGYYFNVIVKDAAGNEAVYTAVTANTTAVPSSGGGTTTSTQPANSAVVEVNGQKQDAGTASTQTAGGQTVTTIKVDDTKLNKILDGSGEKPTVTLPINKASDVVVGELNGQTVKNMEQKAAVLEIKTETVSYTLPADQINIDDVSSQIGEQVALKDIKVSVKIAEPPADTVKVVENTAAKNSYQIVVKPIEFEITCTSGYKTVEVSKFNSYVERTVAIPDGIDPFKITTGIVLNSDGTFSHVPTIIIKVGEKYYAKINSLTNSTYSVIYNPVEFTDVANHWAKTAVNDMGSRMVVTGIGSSTYEPDRSITRAEFAAVVVRALGLHQGKAESSFDDVTMNDWFNGYVDTATAYALITGYDSKTFGPSDTITREQAMAIIGRAMKLTGLTISLTDSELGELLSGYTDGKQVSDYARESAVACLKAGIVTGKTASTISPRDYVTRAEVAVMVQRLLQESGLI